MYRYANAEEMAKLAIELSKRAKVQENLHHISQKEEE
jgi:hypothetical protein